MSAPGEITRLLRRHADGDVVASEALLRLMQADLHHLAEGFMRRQRPDHTLQPTALVHEAYLRMLGRDPEDWRDREQFLALAARAMRSALVDHARARQAQKRGGDAQRQPLDELYVLVDRSAFDLLALEESLQELARESERAARIVELRFFGGLTAEETARVLGSSLRTVERDWRAARAWLAERLEREGEPE